MIERSAAFQDSINKSIILRVKTIAKILDGLRENPNNVRFSDLVKLCDAYFGEPRQKGTSHRIYRTPWPADPRVNIQDAKGTAKPYQVRQVIRAIEKLESMK